MKEKEKEKKSTVEVEIAPGIDLSRSPGKQYNNQIVGSRTLKRLAHLNVTTLVGPHCPSPYIFPSLYQFEPVAKMSKPPSPDCPNTIPIQPPPHQGISLQCSNPIHFSMFPLFLLTIPSLPSLRSHPYAPLPF